MKRLIITEEEKKHILKLHNVLKEQDYLNPKTYGLNTNDFTPTVDNTKIDMNPMIVQNTDKRGITTYSPTERNYPIGNEEKIEETYKLKTENISEEQLIDNIVDILSAALDGFPGIGNLASGITDVVHSLSFFVRSYFAKEQTKKINYIIDGVLTGVFALYPLVGNLANLGLRNTIQSFINKTHPDIISFLASNGIRFTQTTNLTFPPKFTYAFIAAIASYNQNILKNDLANYLKKFKENVISLCGEIMDGINKIIEFLQSRNTWKFFNIFIASLTYVNSFFVELFNLINSMVIDDDDIDINHGATGSW